MGPDLPPHAAAAARLRRLRPRALLRPPRAVPPARRRGDIRVANLTTPAQYFHLLRAQALSDKLRPLIIMTPKSLLRLNAATNRIQHLSDTKFFSVLGEPRVDHEKVERLVLCTGKVYYDLVGHPSRSNNDRVAVGRVELLYPSPKSSCASSSRATPTSRKSSGLQEEPRNMGARAHMFPRLTQMLQDRELRLGYIGRPERASPGEGYPAAHLTEQTASSKPRSTWASRCRRTRGARPAGARSSGPRTVRSAVRAGAGEASLRSGRPCGPAARCALAGLRGSIRSGRLPPPRRSRSLVGRWVSRLRRPGGAVGWARVRCPGVSRVLGWFGTVGGRPAVTRAGWSLSSGCRP